MSAVKPMESFDVFLALSSEHAELGARVEVRMARAGISVYNPHRDLADSARARKAGMVDELRDKLKASRTVVALFDERLHFYPNVAFETGAALGMGKPVYGITESVERPTHSDLPKFIQLFGLADIDRVIDAIRRQRGARGSTRSRDLGMRSMRRMKKLPA